MKLAEVHTLYKTNARSIPDMMRQAAESIETETDEHDKTKAMIAVQLSDDGEIQIYGWGETDDLSAIGTLTKAIHQLAETE